MCITVLASTNPFIFNAGENSICKIYALLCWSIRVGDVHERYKDVDTIRRQMFIEILVVSIRVPLLAKHRRFRRYVEEKH